MNRLRFFRRQADLTQEELGKMVGVELTRIHRYEIERQRCPWEMREKIASALRLPIEVIFPDSEDR
jgi:DNA-binding XRE family transcriptional regulator